MKKIRNIFIIFFTLIIALPHLTNALTMSVSASHFNEGTVIGGDCSKSKKFKGSGEMGNPPSNTQSKATSISGTCSSSGATSASCSRGNIMTGGNYSESGTAIATYRTYMASSIKTETANGSDSTYINANTIDQSPTIACTFSEYTSGTVVNNCAKSSDRISARFNVTDNGCAGARDQVFSGSNGTIQGTSEDKLGNVGRTCIKYYSTDDTVDSCKVTGYSTQACVNHDVTAYVSGTDSCAGIASAPDLTFSDSYVNKTSTCKDKLGNTKSVTTSVTNIDKIAPDCGSLSYQNPGSSYCTRSNVQFTFGCSDNDGRCGNCTSNSYSAWTNGYSGSLTIADTAGNTTTCSMNNAYYDGTAPAITITYGNHDYINADNYTSDSAVTVYLRATDSGNCNGGAGAGINRVCYKLSGATTKGETCVSGSNTSFNITAEGITTITAWTFDNARDNNNGSFTYTTGNRSSDVSRSVYIDRTKPDLTLTTSYDGKWTNKPIITNISTADKAYSDGSHSGVKDIEYYFSISSNPSDIWGAENKNRPASGNNVPVNSYGIATPVGTKASNGTDAAGKGTYTGSISTPQGDKTLSDMIYIHVRSCDRAMTSNSVPAPNCTTKVLGPYYYDEKTDDLIITANNNSHNWTNQLVLTFTVTEQAVSSPMASAGDRKTSGIDRMELYYDVDYVHEQDTLSNAIYPSSFDNNKLNCSSSNDHLMGSGSNSKTCTYTIDFNDLRNDPDTGSSKVMEEGNRFIKVRVYDVAQNYTEKSFGPYRFDITKNKLSNIKFSGQEGLFVEN